MKGYRYMVDAREPKPDLVRYSEDGYERYTPHMETKWSRSKFLDEFAWGGGDFVYYDNISPAKAEEYMVEIEEFWRNREAGESE